MQEYENGKNSKRSTDEWSAVIKRTDSRALARERAERIKYAEQYRQSLNRDVSSYGSDSDREDEREAELRAARAEKIREINEQRKREADARLAEADEKIRRIFGASMRSDADGASENKYIFSTNEEEKSEIKVGATTLTKETDSKTNLSSTYQKKTDVEDFDAYTDPKKKYKVGGGAMSFYESRNYAEDERQLYREPQAAERSLDEELDWQPTARARGKYADKRRSFPEAYGADVDYRPIERSYKKEYTERETDLDAVYADPKYTASADDRSHSYAMQYEAYSDIDEYGAAAPFLSRRRQKEPKYYLRYDSETDMSGADSEPMMSEYGREDGSHLSYAERDEELLGFIRRCGTPYDKRMVENEHIRFLREMERLDRENEENGKKGNTDKLSGSKRANKSRLAAEKSAHAVGARMEYEIEAGERELALELLNFSDYDHNEERRRKKRIKRLSKMKRSLKRAKREEKEATLRYYLISSGNSEYEGRLKDFSPEKLEPIMSALTSLLSERDEINEKLTELYRGAKRRSDVKLQRKGEKIRYTVAKEVHRSLKRKNKRLEKLHAPRDLKNKIRSLFNKKIEAYSTLEYSRYILRKQRPTGILKKELKGDVKRSREELRYIDKDIRVLMKKAEKQHDLHKDDISWMRWLIWIVIIVCVLGVCWYFFGDTIKSFYTR